MYNFLLPLCGEIKITIKKEKKKEINASKIYNSSGEFDEWG